MLAQQEASSVVRLVALLILAAIFGAPRLGIEPPRYMIGLGIVLLSTGIVMLTRFLASYPKPEWKGNHEEQE